MCALPGMVAEKSARGLVSPPAPPGLNDVSLDGLLLDESRLVTTALQDVVRREMQIVGFELVDLLVNEMERRLDPCLKASEAISQHVTSGKLAAVGGNIKSNIRGHIQTSCDNTNSNAANVPGVPKVSFPECDNNGNQDKLRFADTEQDDGFREFASLKDKLDSMDGKAAARTSFSWAFDVDRKREEERLERKGNSLSSVTSAPQDLWSRATRICTQAFTAVINFLFILDGDSKRSLGNRRDTTTCRQMAQSKLKKQTRKLKTWREHSARAGRSSSFVIEKETWNGWIKSCIFHVYLQLQLLLTSSLFDLLVCICLVSNAIFIGIQTDYAAKQLAEPQGFRAIEVAFCIVFTMELCLRILGQGREFFTSLEGWNYFDFLLVGLQLMDEFMQMGQRKTEGVGNSQQSNALRVVRIFKLLRVLRLLRVIRFVGELRKVLNLMMGSFGSFFWTAMLLMLLIFILGILFTQVVADFRSENEAFFSESRQEPQAIQLKEMFGSTISSIFTLYKAITGGFDWQDVSTPLTDNIGPLMGLAFAIYTAFAILVLLNLVTGVFVDSALKLAKADKETELTNKACKMFDGADEARLGLINFQDFKGQLGTKEMTAFFNALEISDTRAEDMFLLLDESEDGLVSIEELVAGGMMLQGSARAFDVALLSRNFQRFSREWTEILREVVTMLVASGNSNRGFRAGDAIQDLPAPGTGRPFSSGSGIEV